MSKTRLIGTKLRGAAHRAGINEACDADDDFVPFAHRDSPVRTFAEADELRFLFAYARCADNERGHASVRRFFHDESVVQDLPVAYDALVCQQQDTLFLLPVEESNGRGGGVAYADLQTGGAAEIGRKLGNGIGG